MHWIKKNKPISTVFLIVSLILFSQFSFSQKSIIKKFFTEAEYYFLYEDYNEALQFYLKVDTTPFTSANIKYKIGICYLFNDFEKDKAIPYLEEAVKNLTSDYSDGSFYEDKAPEDAYFYLGRAYRIANQLDKATEAFKKYKTYLKLNDFDNTALADQAIASCENAKNFKNNPVDVIINNLGTTINGRYSNIHPVVSFDEKMIIYTSKRKFYDAIYISLKRDSSWIVPINITPQIGSDGQFYPSSLSFDKKTLILLKNDVFGDDLYISRYIDETDSWTKAEKLNKNINTDNFETHGCLSPDGKTLYFTSNRPNGLGGLDIFKSTLDEKGEWGIPVNLGPKINSPFDEETPFITENGKTIYFSSQGHNTMGGFDIFYSNNEGENIWSDPVNLGVPINTTDDDLFFSPVNNGSAAYISRISDRGVKALDIFKIEFKKK